VQQAFVTYQGKQSLTKVIADTTAPNRRTTGA